MGLVCGICGTGQSSGKTASIFETFVAGDAVDIRQCPTCGFVYCANCSVFPSGTKVVFTINAAKKVGCPRCNQDGIRADGRLPTFNELGEFVDWRRV
ncbi:MAG: hypothetical protein PHR28_04175 [candidate division Zixibacteria bacterium]|nr:hypothetical protein [candidate division Zixibacteria bacterium]